MNRTFPKPTEISALAAWGNVRETATPVVAGIFAIASEARPAEDIWKAPTQAEWDAVSMAVAEFVRHGDFERDADDRYQWGEETLIVSPDLTT